MKKITTLGELHAQVVHDKGGACRECDCNPQFEVTSPQTDFRLKPDSQASMHNFRPAALKLRVVCDGDKTPHRAVTKKPLEHCRLREHALAKRKRA